MPTRKVSLPKALDLFVNRTIKTGRYDNASDVICAGLRLLVREEKEKENAEKFAWLKEKISEHCQPGYRELIGLNEPTVRRTGATSHPKDDSSLTKGPMN